METYAHMDEISSTTSKQHQKIVRKYNNGCESHQGKHNVLWK